MKKQPQAGRKHLQKYKRHFSKIYKELSKLNNKIINETVKKMVKDRERHLTKEDIRMENKGNIN